MRAQAIIVVIGIPLGLFVLWLTTPEQLERMPPLCVWKAVTGKPCPGCGTTRALCCLTHGDWRRALDYNRIIVVLVPVLAWLWLAQMRWFWVRRASRRKPDVPAS
ncbi:hypothetical protein AYO40_04340 [Planctomycetaceae bacterium SCGC AG-212-D15]|nr:hypothetical protein AYO40_04340 [Planctomycetaceae bacterium SCGC AG-212-D15]